VKTLLDDQFAPITSTAGFLEAPLSEVGAAFDKWNRALRKRAVVTPLAEPFPKVLHRLEPLTQAVAPRNLLLATRSGWTAYFDNGWRGTDAGPPVGYLTTVLKCRGLAVTCVPHTVSKQDRKRVMRYGAVQFHLFGPEERECGNYIRAIDAVNDGGRWVFETSGTMRAFEQPERYEERLIRHRFTADMLEAYCASLGVLYFDPDFLRSSGTANRYRGAAPPRVPRDEPCGGATPRGAGPGG